VKVIMKHGRWILGAATVAALAVGALVATRPVSAATATANLSATASVANNCTISTGTVDFGSYDPIVAHASGNLDANGTVTITCTKGAMTTIGLNLGANASGSTRRMTDGSSNYMTYELYQEVGRTTVWGNSGGGLLTPAAAPSSAPHAYTVYGRVTAAQDVPAGSYSDTVVATVTF
jgi:spore coat protein U-like protein